MSETATAQPTEPLTQQVFEQIKKKIHRVLLLRTPRDSSSLVDALRVKFNAVLDAHDPAKNPEASRQGLASALGALSEEERLHPEAPSGGSFATRRNQTKRQYAVDSIVSAALEILMSETATAQPAEPLTQHDFEKIKYDVHRALALGDPSLMMKDLTPKFDAVLDAYDPAKNPEASRKGLASALVELSVNEGRESFDRVKASGECIDFLTQALETNRLRALNNALKAALEILTPDAVVSQKTR